MICFPTAVTQADVYTEKTKCCRNRSQSFLSSFIHISLVNISPVLKQVIKTLAHIGWVFKCYVNKSQYAHLCLYNILLISRLKLWDRKGDFPVQKPDDSNKQLGICKMILME